MRGVFGLSVSIDEGFYVFDCGEDIGELQKSKFCSDHISYFEFYLGLARQFLVHHSVVFYVFIFHILS